MISNVYDRALRTEWTWFHNPKKSLENKTVQKTAISQVRIRSVITHTQ